MPEPRRRRDEANGPRPRPTKAERRQRALAAAQSLFEKHGYAEVTAEEVAEAAGVTPAALARDFDGKAALLRALCARLHEVLFPAPADGQPPPDAVAALLALTGRFLDAVRGEGKLLRALFAAARDDEGGAVVCDALAAAAEAIAVVLRAGQGEGFVRRSIDPWQAAWDWVRFLLGYAFLDQLAPQPQDDEEPAADLVDTLLHGVLKTDI
jgi:AcrR family transcriptional regulator